MTSELPQAVLFEKMGPYPNNDSEIYWNPNLVDALFLQHFGHDYRRGNLIQYLNVIQNRFGTICQSAIHWLAKRTHISSAEIRGVIEFYSFLTTGPAPSFHILFANNIIEEHCGLKELFNRITEKLEGSRAKISQTSCIGLSDQPLSALVNGFAVGNICQQNADEFCQLILDERPLTQWPKHWFEIRTHMQYSGPLTDYHYVPGKAIKQADVISSEGIIREIKLSGLRGLGGAGFSTARKWQLCAEQNTAVKYVVCNADEGEPGTFKDRYYLIHQFERMIEGMIIAAKAVGASKGYVYLRGEYLNLHQHIENELEAKRQQGWLTQEFDIELHLGAGAYVCGEESALIESIEGKRGIPRRKPPYPGQQGLFGKPTIINNVETFVCATYILHDGGKKHSTLGTKNSKGSRMLSVSGDCKKPGLYNLAFGTTLRELISLCQADDVLCIQVGGASGHLFFSDEIDGPFDFENKGCGCAIMIFNRSRNPLQIAQNYLSFFRHESCGFCTPCRVGTQILPKLLSTYSDNNSKSKNIQKDILELCELLDSTSHCGLGKTAGRPVMHYLRGRGRNE